MTDEPAPIWGYAPPDRARVFDDGVLPAGWSPDISVLPENLRNGEYVSRADLSERVESRPVAVAGSDKTVQVVKSPEHHAKRGPGRPPKSHAPVTETVHGQNP